MTHEYTLLVGGTVIVGGGEPDAEAIAWADDTILALGSDAEVRGISRGDSHVAEIPGAFVVSLSAPLEVGGPADVAVLDADPRGVTPGPPREPRAVIRSGRLVAGALAGFEHGEHERLVIRPAAEADAPAIRSLVSTARLNPRDLDWRRFLVADVAGEIVACAQVRVHGGGSRELASVAVLPTRRGAGIGRRISEAALAREPARPIYLYTESRTEDYWANLGFRTVEGDAIPRDMAWPLRIARVATALYALVTRQPYRIVVMRRSES